MADALRYPGFPSSDPVPDQPNMNVVPPAAPLGSADAATTAGASYRDDFITTDPDELLDPEYGYADGRSYGEEDFLSATRNVFSSAFEAVRDHVNYISESIRSGSLQDDLQERAEHWMDRAAGLAGDLSDSASTLASNARFRASELKGRIAERSHDVQESTQRFINERPTQAIAVAAGAGFLLGVVLRLGRSRREY